MVEGDRLVKPGIQERTFRFALRILKLVKALPGDVSGQIVSRQIARSGTGVGGNVEEAQGAQTKKEFARKMNIARSEALETRYWLRLVAEASMVPRDRLGDLIQESEELVKVLTAIVKKARENDSRSNAAKRTQQRVAE